MIKGTTKIELTDVKSGKKEVIEKHNLVTNAIKEFMTPYCGNYSELIPQNNTDGTAASWGSLVGGLLLFDEEIPENANTFFPQNTAKLVGCANTDTTSSVGDIVRGTYNYTESQYNKTSKTLKLVYDFATSQANGTIASVCVTNIDGGWGNYGNDKTYPSHSSGELLKKRGAINHLLTTNSPLDTINFNDLTQYMLAIDLKNQCQYRLVFVDSTHIKIIKREMPLRTVSLIDNSANIISTTEITLPNAIPTKCVSFNFDSGNIYIVSSTNSPVAANGTFNITEILLDSPNTVTQYTVTNMTEKSIHTKTPGSTYKNSYVHDGYFYTTATDWTAQRIQVSNSTNHEYLGLLSTNNYCVSGSVGGRVFFVNYSDSSGSTFVYNESTQTLKTTATKTHDVPGGSNFPQVAIIPDVSNKMFSLLMYYNYSHLNDICAYTDYLATINNLPTSIIKTADKTMKITYVLQEIDEE